LIEAEKWAYREKEEIGKLRQLLRVNLVKAAEIVKQTHEDIKLVERVKAGEEQQTVLKKVLDNIPHSENDNFFFYPNR
jgi:hypothetical protein